jgi:hypothetical protein
MYINHITLSTGHLARTSRADVADETLAVLAPWLNAGLREPTNMPLPVPSLSHYSAKITLGGGALLVTIMAPGGPHTAGRQYHGKVVPLATVGVAQRSRQTIDLWAMMVAQYGAVPGLQQPGTPWCAVALHAGLAAYPNAVHWLGDLERCLAWAWITRNAQLVAT